MSERELVGVVIAGAGLLSTILLGFVKADLIESDPDRGTWPPHYRKLKDRERISPRWSPACWSSSASGLWGMSSPVIPSPLLLRPGLQGVVRLTIHRPPPALTSRGLGQPPRDDVLGGRVGPRWLFLSRGVVGFEVILGAYSPPLMAEMDPLSLLG